MNWADLPKDFIRNCSATQAKAVHMIRRGKSDEYVSDYLGMDIRQVRSIRSANLRGMDAKSHFERRAA